MQRTAFQKYPRTPHLPGSGAVTKDDIVLAPESRWDFLSSTNIVVEEKIDGANVRIKWDGDGDLIVGNREHTLLKGYVKRDTPAKLQFRPMWNWLYDRRKLFQKLNRAIGISPFTVYGEWMYAEHSIHYDRLPDLLIPFAVKFDDSPLFMDPVAAREALMTAGFTCPPLIAQSGVGPPDIQQRIEVAMKPSTSRWSAANREGIYIKCGDGRSTTERIKFVDPGFKPISDFTERGLRRNTIHVAE